MPADMTEAAGLEDTYGERTRMMTWRVAALALTILVSGAVAPIVVRQFGDGTVHGSILGLRAMGIFVATIMVAGTLSVFFFTRDAPKGIVVESEKSTAGPAAGGRAEQAVPGAGDLLRRARPRASPRCSPGVQYFANHSCTTQTRSPLLFVCVVGPAILVMPVWNRVGARIGKLKGYVAASLIITAGTLSPRHARRCCRRGRFT